MDISPSTSPPVYLSGYNLNFFARDRHILHDISVCFQPNELVFIMGPSGGGKTTLMDVISGRANSGRVEGQVMMGDKLMNPRELKVVANYVPQDDILYVGLTVREHLWYTAELRLPETVSKADKEARVEQILDALSIQECADTIVGGIEIRGVSGGQKKRTSVGMELVTNPSGLFLDECTTGLDSKTAEDLIRLLSNLAHGGRTIMCSIHQPSPQVFSMLDRLIFLSAGRIVYDGPGKNIVPYFASIGHACPPDENAADFVMEVVSAGGPEAAETFNQKWSKSANQYQADWTIERLRALPDIARALENEVVGSTQPTYATSVQYQFKVLFERAFWNYARDIWGYPFRIVMGMMGGIMFGLFFPNLDNSQRDVILKEALYTMIMALGIYDHILGTATVFPGERGVVLREYQNGYYRLFAYYSSRMLMVMITQLPYTVVMVTCTWSISTLVPGFWHYIMIIFMTWIASMNASCVGMFIGVFVPDVTSANIVIPAVGLFTVTANGFFVLPDNMPFYIKGWTYINYGSRSFENFLINEFHNQPFEPCASPDPNVCPFGSTTEATLFDGDTVLDSLDYEADTLWGNNIFNICSIVFWFFLAYFALKYRVQQHSK